VDSAILGLAILIAFGLCFLPTIIVEIRRRSAEADVRDFHGRQLNEDSAIYQEVFTDCGVYCGLLNLSSRKYFGRAGKYVADEHGDFIIFYGWAGFYLALGLHKT
jgi:hypothetical protein